MNLKQLNIFNLTQLWKITGQYNFTNSFEFSESLYGCWPNKTWLKQALNKTILQEIKGKWNHRQFSISSFNTFSAQELEILNAEGFKETKQTGMSIKLDHFTNDSSLLSYQKVTCLDTAKAWSQVFETAFKYQISHQTVFATMHLVDYYIAINNGTKVGTAMLFIDNNKVAGIHSMGIIPTERRKGYARKLLRTLLNKAKNQKASIAVLQASEAGKPLYLQEGFREDFIMQTFKIN